jgi:radical SAM protein with 4Fe4S-binding SPASM domain
MTSSVWRGALPEERAGTVAEAGGRHAVLASDWALRGYADRTALVDWRSGAVVPLSATGVYVARSCDGVADFTSPFYLPRHHATLERMLAAGMAVECPAGTPLDPGQRLRTAPNRYLRLVNWGVTGLCNLSCRHCYMEAPAGEYGELPTEVLLGILGQFERANVVSVHLTGGEALLRGDFWTLVEELTRRRIGIHQISTNGLLLDGEGLARLRDLGADPVFHFSFDGVGTHDAMRGVAGVEAETLEVIRRTAVAGSTVAVTSCLDAQTLPGILRMPDLLSRLGVHTWHVDAPLPMGLWSQGSPTELTLEEQTQACETLLRRWLELGRPYRITLCRLFYGAPAGDDSWTAAQGAAAGGRSLEDTPDAPAGAGLDEPRCPYLFDDVAYVMPDGRFMPCLRFIGTPVQDEMPTLLERELGEVWDDEGLRARFGVTKRQLRAADPECAACPEFGVCGAGCVAFGCGATGDLLSRDSLACAVTRGGYKERLATIAGA